MVGCNAETFLEDNRIVEVLQGAVRSAVYGAVEMVQPEAPNERILPSVGIAASVISAEREAREPVLDEVTRSHLSDKARILIGCGEAVAWPLEEHIHHRLAGGTQQIFDPVFHNPRDEPVEIRVPGGFRKVHEVYDAQGPVWPFACEAYYSLAEMPSVGALSLYQNAYCRHVGKYNTALADFVITFANFYKRLALPVLVQLAATICCVRLEDTSQGGIRQLRTMKQFLTYTRKSFLEAGMAAAAVPSAFADVGRTAKPSGLRRLRLGVLSDLHIVDAASAGPFEAVLRIFDREKADGVLVCGDLTDFGTETQLKLLADAWFKVFPGGKRSDGEPIANLMHYGDHDICDKTYRDRKKCVNLYPDEEAMKKVLLIRDRKGAWERCFREPWAPIVHKRVKGYDFVLSHFTRGEKGNEGGNSTPGLASFMSSLKLDPKKPFFHSQHRIYRGTACGPKTYGQDDGSTGSIFSAKYPNVIAFCGHGHQSSTNDQILWQGAFTAIEVPSLCYCITGPGRENGFAMLDWPYTYPAYTMKMRFGEGHDFIRQGLIVDVYDNCVNIVRHEFKYADRTGHDLAFPLPSPGDRPFSFENRSRTVPAPVFPDGATVRVREVREKDRMGDMQDMYELSFPPASMTATTPRANEYEVCVESQWGDVVKVEATRRFYSSAYNWGDAYDRKPVICRMLKSDLPLNRPARFVVSPMNSYYVRGKALTTWFMKRKEK